jgi:hypothetical protein
LPWALPASVVMALTSSDLDRSSAAAWSPEAYKWVLRRIVTRIQDEADEAGFRLVRHGALGPTRHWAMKTRFHRPRYP